MTRSDQTRSSGDVHRMAALTLQRGHGLITSRCRRSAKNGLMCRARANAHVHWHVAPLPPGVPYEQQQFRAVMALPIELPHGLCRSAGPRAPVRFVIEAA